MVQDLHRVGDQAGLYLEAASKHCRENGSYLQFRGNLRACWAHLFRDTLGNKDEREIIFAFNLFIYWSHLRCYWRCYILQNFVLSLEARWPLNIVMPKNTFLWKMCVIEEECLFSQRYLFHWKLVLCACYESSMFFVPREASNRHRLNMLFYKQMWTSQVLNVTKTARQTSN